MIFLKRLKGTKLSANPLASKILREYKERNINYAMSIHDAIAQVISGIVENH